jgi:hypothetical protein
MVCCTVHWPLAEADLGVVEFQGLWRYIKEWQDVFKHFDRDRSGSIDGQELSAALKSFGYQLSPMLLNMIEQKYGESDFGKTMRRRWEVLIFAAVASGPVAGYGPPPGITFDRFVRACVVVKTLTEAFQA